VIWALRRFGLRRNLRLWRAVWRNPDLTMDEAWDILLAAPTQTRLVIDISSADEAELATYARWYVENYTEPRE